MKLTEVPVPNPFLVIAPVLSALLLVLAFPNYNVGMLAWVGLVPLHVAVIGTKPKYAFILSLFSGALFFSFAIWWIFSVPGYKPVHHAILSLYLGLYFGLYGLLVNIISKRMSVTFTCLSSPFIWVTLEYLRSNLSFLAVPWALVAHSQHQNLAVIQIASFAGAYGVSFLIVLVNTAIARVIVAQTPLWKGLAGLKNAAQSTSGRVFLPVATAGLLILVFGYGQNALSGLAERRIIKASVLQGNINQEMKGNPRKHRAYIMEKYADLTRRAASDKPDLIVWPEAATPGFVLKDIDLYSRLVRIIRGVNTYFVVGSSEYPKFSKTKTEFMKSGNTALFFSPEGKVLGQYLKIHLVPFWECIPLEGIIDWPRFIVPGDKKLYEIPGQEYTLFNLKDAKFGVIICWENVFAEQFRTFVKNGADFMLNITNEGWFGDTAAPHQMLAISVFRAVENRCAIARAANTGISCFIDPHGRITGRVQDNQKKDTFVEGYLTGAIPIPRHKTFYTQHGEVFVYFCIAIALLTVAVSFARGKK